MAILREAFETGIKELRKDLTISETTDDVKQKTPLKGFDFEDAVENLLCSIARNHGDVIERTSDKPGLVEKSKKGDFVAIIGGRASSKIVFELKNKHGLSYNEIESELKDAIENRNADYGVLVAHQVNMLPKSVG